MRPRGFFARLLATHLIVAIGAVAFLGIAVDRVFEHRAIEDLEQRLVSEARTVQAAISRLSTGIPVQPEIQALGDASGARLTVIRTDGVVLADSEHDPATMENHATPSRPEVLAAIGGRTGSDQRVSETLGVPYLYVAIPAKQGVVVRAALPAERVASQRSTIRWIVLLSFLGIAAVASGLSLLMARSVSRPLRKLADEVTKVGGGEFATVDPTGATETRALARVVNSMANELAQRLDDLRGEAELRDQILGAMDEAVILAEKETVVFANRAAGELLGVVGGQTLPPHLARPKDDNATVSEFVVYHPITRDVHSTASRLHDGRLLIVAEDVTDARRIDRIRRDFVANASHEMKTPVAGILAAAETLHDAIKEDPVAAQRFATNLAKEARRLADMIQDLLDLARLDQGPAEEGIAPLSTLVLDVVEDARGRAAEKQLALDAEIASGIEITGRSPDLILLLRNLLDNAIRYTPEGGHVWVKLGRENGDVRLSVRDSGIGIPEKDLPRIFERFYRVDKARARDTGGTGLGLSIVRHIAESHGGTVSAESELGAGSTFTVSLPPPTG